ncbi:helix-turn-helix domain-containing protein [Brenneria tiliae]|uniref:helix-turn-helix domain-containing protein n=1 Tax=Brenneria tiliae TaxID=2914984 RepID=UPI002014887B|nr:helix-turn-helix domain-containing protein [Brenneria tiliae]MCL2898695.1 helix-turn-helix domain-containing protein [Brenneria tiliae]MCL2903368.1 helix-turn-helix domain-containing protein [Brenneria tiliae]
MTIIFYLDKGTGMVYPEQSISRLTKMLSPHAHAAIPSEVVRGKRRYHLHSSGEQVIYFLDEGEFLIKRTRDNKVISVILSPTIVGWSLAALKSDDIYIERVDYGKIRCLPFNIALRVVTAYQRFDDVLIIINFWFHFLIDFCADNDGDSLSIVKNMLLSLNKLPPDVRRRYTALTFIAQRTSLSKSTIFRVLKKLQTEKLIELERGRLKKIAFSQPVVC